MLCLPIKMLITRQIVITLFLELLCTIRPSVIFAGSMILSTHHWK